MNLCLSEYSKVLTYFVLRIVFLQDVCKGGYGEVNGLPTDLLFEGIQFV